MPGSAFPAKAWGRLFSPYSSSLLPCNPTRIPLPPSHPVFLFHPPTPVFLFHPPTPYSSSTLPPPLFLVPIPFRRRTPPAPISKADADAALISSLRRGTARKQAALPSQWNTSPAGVRSRAFNLCIARARADEWTSAAAYTPPALHSRTIRWTVHRPRPRQPSRPTLQRRRPCRPPTGTTRCSKRLPIGSPSWTRPCCSCASMVRPTPPNGLTHYLAHFVDAHPTPPTTLSPFPR